MACLLRFGGVIGAQAGEIHAEFEPCCGALPDSGRIGLAYLSVRV
jgi:hypothetical protein